MPAKKPQAKRSKQQKPRPQRQRQRPRRQPQESRGTHVAKIYQRIHSNARDYGLSNEAKSLALAIALPDQCPAMRLPTSDMPRSSINVVSDQYSWATPTTGWTANGFPDDSMVVLLYGQPGRSMMVWQSDLPTQSATGTNYVMRFDSQSGVSWPISAGDQLLRTGGYWPLVGALRNPSFPVGPHGETLSIGTTKNANYVFLNAGDQLVVGSTSGALGTMDGYLTFGVDRWSGRDQAPYTQTSVTAVVTAGTVVSTVLLTAPVAGYYAVSFSEGQITVGLAGSGEHPILCYIHPQATSGFKLLHPADVDPISSGDINILTDTRVNASALLITNTTSVLNRQGSVIAARMRAVDGMMATYEGLGRAAEKYTGGADKGVYTFKEFTEEAALFTSCNIRGVNGAWNGVCFDLDVDDFYHLIYISGDSAARNTYNVKLTTAYEYKTEVARYPKAVTMHRFEALVEARRLISSNPNWFYENPLHMLDIYRFVRDKVNQVGRIAAKISPFAAGAISAVAPEFAAPAMAANSFLQKLYG